MSPPLLSARGLCCTLGDKAILRGIDLDLAAGEIVGILGPNGAGKSTLLRCLAGLLPCDGTIHLGSQRLGSLTTRQVARQITLLHQGSGDLSAFPSSQIVMMGRYPHQRRFQGASREDCRIVGEAMAFTGTLPLADQTIDTLSGGERQRVLFAKSMAQDTPVLLLDEPNASLDLSSQEQIFRYAQKLAAEGKAVGAVIHDLRLAARYCTQVLLLSQGRVLASGPAAQVLTPAHLKQAYGVRVRVYRNQATGDLDFQVWEGEFTGTQPTIHVIGGGGTAGPLLRTLSEAGYPVTCGVLSPGDSDLHVAEVYGIPAIVSPPFTPIDDKAHRENEIRAAAAQITVVCHLVFGPQNLRNLEAAAQAQTLVLLEDGPPEHRDFTGGPGLAVYRTLRERATVLTTQDWPGWLSRWPTSSPSA